MSQSNKSVSHLRQRMIDDMTLRKLSYHRQPMSNNRLSLNLSIDSDHLSAINKRF